MSITSSLHAPSRLSGPSAVAVVLAALALCGLIDYITGYEVSVFALYVIPIVLGMRFFGTAAGCVMAVLSAVVWLVADQQAGHQYALSWTVYWNALHRLFFFLCVVLGVHHTQATLRLNAKRVQAFSGALPICTQCHRIGSGSGYWQKFESYLGEHGGAQPLHKVCPDCAREGYAKAGVIERASPQR